MNPSISVIIPHYNNSDTIEDTLNSLVQQTKPVYEVIIVDDFSLEYASLIDIVDSYRNKLPIKLIRNKENRNGAFSRNEGIKIATGKIIAFLDADDIWLPEKVQTIMEKVHEFGKDNLFFSKVKIFSKGNFVITMPNQFNPNIHVSEYLFLEDGFIQTSSIFCSATIAKNILFQDKFKRHQDYDFVLRAAFNGVKFYFINKELSIYKTDVNVDLSKGEGSKYSKWWAKEMKPYFSNEGFKGFHFFNVTARMLVEKRYALAFFNALKWGLSFNVRSYSRIYPKLTRIFKREI